VGATTIKGALKMARAVIVLLIQIVKVKLLVTSIAIACSMVGEALVQPTKIAKTKNFNATAVASVCLVAEAGHV
jgi:hypothetical protein